MSIYRRYAEAYAKSGHARWSLQLVPWVLGVFARYGATPASLVDVACGPGEFALAMAQRGLRVTGVDQSAEMLAIARRAAEDRALPAAFVEQDMREFRLPAPVDAATCLYDSLNYIVDEAEFRHTLEAVAAALRPAGLFLFDMNTLHGLATRWGNRVWVIEDSNDTFEADQTEFNYDTGIATVRINAFLLRPGGLYERVQETHRERGYPAAEIDHGLAGAGFEVLGRWGSPEFAEVTPETGRVFYAARRRG